MHPSWLTGKAEGVLFEDDGDGYEFTKGSYLLTHYVAELKSSVVTVSVHKTDGSWERPKRRLHIQLLLGGGAMVCAFLWDETTEFETRVKETVKTPCLIPSFTGYLILIFI